MQLSGIASIVISENPVTLARDGFLDNLILGKKSAWVDNSYTHETRAMGGFWKCKFDLMPNRLGIGYLEEYLENGLGRDVKSYTANEGLAWEGFISRLELKYPGGSIIVSLVDMANRTWVRYLTAEGGLLKRSTVQNDTVSQGKFGIKEEVLSGAIISDGNVADQLAAAYLAEYADPGRSRVNIKLSSRDMSGVRLKVSCHGYFRTLDWRTYNKVTAHTEQNVNLQIGDIITAVGQFIASTNLATNTSQVSQEYDRDEPASGLILGLSRMADGSNNRYICGVYKDRILRYEQSQTLSSEDDMKYKIRIRDNKSVVRTVDTNREISPAAVRPNDWVRIVDVLSGNIRTSTDIKKDPQVTFVESIVFNEPDRLTIPGNRAVQIDNLMAKSGFGGVSQI